MINIAHILYLLGSIDNKLMRIISIMHFVSYNVALYLALTRTRTRTTTMGFYLIWFVKLNWTKKLASDACFSSSSSLFRDIVFFPSTKRFLVSYSSWQNVNMQIWSIWKIWYFEHVHHAPPSSPSMLLRFLLTKSSWRVRFFFVFAHSFGV